MLINANHVITNNSAVNSSTEKIIKNINKNKHTNQSVIAIRRHTIKTTGISNWIRGYIQTK